MNSKCVARSPLWLGRLIRPNDRVRSLNLPPRTIPVAVPTRYGDAMIRALTAPGYIYSAVKDDAKSQAFFEDQYLRFVDRYDDVLADDPDLTLTIDTVANTAAEVRSRLKNGDADADIAAWLDASNFDADDAQRASLSTSNTALW